MFWLFIVFPASSFSSLETLICTTISDQTYLEADYSQPCHWDYPDSFWDLQRWSPLAITSAAYFFIYVIGTPMTILVVMLCQRVPAIASKKIEEVTVVAMIQSCMADTSPVSSSRLASFRGQALSDRELRRQIQELCLGFFPDHARCETGCAGHHLPPTPFLGSSPAAPRSPPRSPPQLLAAAVRRKSGGSLDKVENRSSTLER